MQNESADNVNNVSGLLKAFVVLGGAVLVVGMLLLAVMVVMRSMGAGDPQLSERVSTEPIDLALPAGVRVGQVVVDGKRMVLLGEGPDGQQYITVVDTDTGTRKALIRVTSEE